MSTILVVESDEATRTAIKQFIRFEGYPVDAAASGGEALSHLRASAEIPGLIILELGMEMMDGWDFLFALRQEERFKNIPVVVTAHPLDKIRPIAADAVLAKPIDLDALLRLCMQWCGRPARGQMPEFSETQFVN